MIDSKNGQVPSTIKRIDVIGATQANAAREVPHIHFSDGLALSVDGTVKHTGKRTSLSNNERKFLKKNGIEIEGWT